MLHRFRFAMVRPGRPRLSGWVEVEEAYVGGVEGAVPGRETATKSIVAIAVEIKQPKGFGRIRLHSVDDVSPHRPIPFIEAVVSPARLSTPLGGRRTGPSPSTATRTSGP